MVWLGSGVWRGVTVVKRRGTISGQTDAMDALTASIKADVNSLNNRLDELDVRSMCHACVTPVCDHLPNVFLMLLRDRRGVKAAATGKVKRQRIRLVW